MAETIQQLLARHLLARSKQAAAQEALRVTERTELLRLGELAMRSASNEMRTQVCREIKLALDSPENGGTGRALDFVITKQPHPVQEGLFLYRAKFDLLPPYDLDSGFTAFEVSKLIDRLVGMYVVRNIIMPEV